MDLRMAHQAISSSAAAPGRSAIGSIAVSNSRPTASADLMTALPEYLVDAFQRNILFLDILRQRGDEEVEITSTPMATVLHFDHELVMSGRSLARPMNYSLYRIVPPKGVMIDPLKRPVVVVDPRAGEGPGIGGFKTESEVGDALHAGHPVYFIGFGSTPAPGQQFLDVVEGQVAFFERVVELHPNAPRPFAIGNCQAGYQTLMVAMLRPDLFGPCLVVGSPMSYWQGVHGKNPMRYSGGLLGGSWLTAMTSDLGNGIFDGTWLVLNFDNLGPANWLWGKQYQLYSEVDTDGERYLDFEKWWGDFIQLNGDELQYLVDNLFIGDKLTRNQLKSHDGVTFDIRNILSPIIVFTSDGDNISPPPQALGWIVDLYRDVEDIRAAGQTILYCMAEKIGHLALFVSGKVGAEQDEEFVQLMNVIDCLPPGLYEMVISPKADNAPSGGFATGDWRASFEARTLDDIRAVGRNSPGDDRAFAAVARVSEMNLFAYRTFAQPLVRALANQPAADLLQALNPLRLSYTIFASGKPWMSGIQKLANKVTIARKPAAANNPFVEMQTMVSDQIVASLKAYRVARDQLAEHIFFGFYGSPFVQALLGLKVGIDVRPQPGVSQEEMAARKSRLEKYAAKLETGGFDEALIRGLIYVVAADRILNQQSAFALNLARRHLMRLSLEDFKILVRDQFFVLQLSPEHAIEAVALLVREAELREKLMEQLRRIVGADHPPSIAERERLDRLSRVLATPVEPLAALAIAAGR
jgi:hypothetical protein